MTTPGNYPYGAVQVLWGGVRDDIQNNVVDADTAALAAVQAQAMSAEDRRRLLASQRPGHGAEVPLPQPPAAAGVGISDVDMPVAGLGFSVAPVASEAQVAAYMMPSYAAPEVGGAGFQAGRQEAPMRVFTVQRSRSAPDGVVVVSPPRRRNGLLARLLRRKD